MQKKTYVDELEKLSDAEILREIAYHQKRAALNLVFVTYFIVISLVVSAVAYVVITDRLKEVAEKADHEQRLLEQQRRINEANGW